MSVVHFHSPPRTSPGIAPSLPRHFFVTTTTSPQDLFIHGRQDVKDMVDGKKFPGVLGLLSSACYSPLAMKDAKLPPEAEAAAGC
jgi:hypothetical protein